MDLPILPELPDVIDVPTHLPQGVKRIIETGGGSFIGIMDDQTVLKYPFYIGAALDQLELEKRMFCHVGPHPYLIEYKGMTADGIKLAFAPNGALGPYIESNSTTLIQRLTWSKQLAEAIYFIHSKRVLHCDINLTNILLDEKLTVRLCDLQGRLLDEHSRAVIDAGASEYAKFRLPTARDYEASISTDLFALGTTIYHIVHGHELYPELDLLKDEAETIRRLKAQDFTHMDPNTGGEVILRCWRAQYASAEAIVNDLAKLIH